MSATLAFKESNLTFPTIITKRLVLNEIQEADKKSIFELFSNEEVTKYYDLEAFENVQQAENLITLVQSRFEDQLGIRWAIRMKDHGKLIGTCGFNSWNVPFRSTTIGYDINRQCWGNGYITEALKPIIKMAFNGKLSCGNINRIQADTIPGNLASEKVLKKLGFREEGIRRQSAYWKNKYHDLKSFSLLRDEYEI